MGAEYAKIMPVLVWARKREAPEETEGTANIAKSVKNVLERGKVYVKGTSIRMKM